MMLTDPSYSQDYNKYSYARNNPIRYTDPTGNTVYLVDGNPVDDSNVHYLTSHGNIDNVSYGGNLKEQGIYSGMSYFKLTGQLFTAQQAYELKQGIKNGTVTYSERRRQFGSWENRDGKVVFETNKKGDKVYSYETVSAWLPFGDVFKGFGNIEISEAQSNGGGLSGTDKAGYGLNAFGFANGAKTELIDYAVRSGSSQAGIRAELQVLGKTGTRYLSAANGLGFMAGVAGVAVTGIDAYNKGQWQNHHTADVLIGVGSLYLLTGPVGWAVGGGYFLLDVGIKSYTGKSITENLFDKP
jgi:hypothetical protein